MNTLYLKTLYQFQYKQKFTEDVLSFIQQEIPKYKYPVGCILTYIIQVDSINYLTDYMNNRIYLFQAIDDIYSNYYSQNERRIIACYIAQKLLLKYQWRDKVVAKDIFSLLYLNTNKEEIRGLQDELKYKYGMELILERQSDFNLLGRIIRELETTTAPSLPDICEVIPG